MQFVPERRRRQLVEDMAVYMAQLGTLSAPEQQLIWGNLSRLGSTTGGIMEACVQQEGINSLSRPYLDRMHPLPGGADDLKCPPYHCVSGDGDNWTFIERAAAYHGTGVSGSRHQSRIPVTHAV